MPETDEVDQIPAVVVADDGQLGRVYEMLEALGVEPERVQASKARHGIVKPRDLIVMSWHPTRGLPELHDNAEGSEPIRVCFHSQDFLPLRERLRDLGVHYLVQSALDNDSLRALFQSLLRRGSERRDALRLPLGGVVTVQHGEAKLRCKLADLSETTCRVVSIDTIPEATEVCVVLPQGLAGDAPLEIAGRVIRSQPARREARMPSSAVVRFTDPSEAVRAQLARVMAGDQIGTRATPLQPAVAASPGPSPELSSPPDRRDGDRAKYERRVGLLDLDAAPSVLGRDLSISGVAVTGAPPVPVGSQVTLALYGGKREEPVLVQASVARCADGELGLSFIGLDDAQRRRIERLMGGASQIESLRADAGDARRIVTRMVATG